jgi:hypothetical protein
LKFQKKLIHALTEKIFGKTLRICAAKAMLALT